MRTLSSVARRPIFIATCLHDSSSKIRYLIIRCIRTGIVLSQASTWLLICAAAAFRSSKSSSSRSSCPGSTTTSWAIPVTLKLFGAKGKSCMDPFTVSTTTVFLLFFNRRICSSVSFTSSQASMYCSKIPLSIATASLLLLLLSGHETAPNEIHHRLWHLTAVLFFWLIQIRKSLIPLCNYSFLCLI